MTDRTAALTEALPCEDPEEPCDADGRDRRPWCENCIARNVLRNAALPADWCGHDAAAMDHAACHEWHESDEATIARLRRIEEAARDADLRWWDADGGSGAVSDAMRALRTALEG